MKTFNLCLNDDETDNINSEGLGLTHSSTSRNRQAVISLNSVSFDHTIKVLLISVPITTLEETNLTSFGKKKSPINDFDISAWRLDNCINENADGTFVDGTLFADDSLMRGDAKAQLIGESDMVSPSNYSADHSSAALEEKMLLNKLAQGDRQAFWQLWELYRHYLEHRCRVWMGKNYFDVKDVMSQSALKAWEKLPNYAENIADFKGWLNRLVHNLCMDVHRQRARAVSVENIDDIPLNNQEIEMCSSDYPELALLQQELKIYLRYCIVNFPSRLREPLILRYYRDMSYADISQKLAISQDNVSKRLQQAKQILKKHLCQYFSGCKTVANDEVQFQLLEQEDFQMPVHIDSSVVEISYGITASCLETLPLWCNFLPAQDWI